MSERKEKYVVIVQESVAGSVIKDLVTFGMFAGLMYFNHQYLSGSTWVDVMFILFVFLSLIGRNSKYVFKGNVVDGIKWLQEKDSKEA